MENEKVIVISNTQGPLGIDLPQLMFKREWPNRGAKVKIPKDIFEEMMYDNGVHYMFENGMLYTENLQDSIDAGLEPEGTETRVNVIILSDEERLKLLTTDPLWKFKEVMSKITYEECQNLADYAIEHEILPSIDKCEIIREITGGKDIINAIKLERLDKEA